MSNLPPRRPGARDDFGDDYRDPSRSGGKSTTTLTLLIVAGVAVVVLCGCGGILTALLLPAVQQGREAARRSTSKNNLKQVGIASHNFHDTHGHFPPFGVGENSGNGSIDHPVSFCTSILPFLEQTPTYQRIDFSKPWDDPANQAAYATVLPVLLNPSLPDSGGPAPYGATNYVQNRLLVAPDGRGLGFRDITDGSSNTMLAGDIRSNIPAWGKPDTGRDLARGLGDGPDQFGSMHTGGAQFLMGDGSVRFISENAAPEILEALGTPNGGEAVGDF